MDTELRRVAINCSVYEYGRWEGGSERGGRVEIHFPIFIPVKFFKYPCISAVQVKYLQYPTTNVKLDVKHIFHILHKKMTEMSTAPARRMSLMESHQNHCNLGLDALH